jgi:nucleoside-diphosphate-sugar epimerase
VPLLHEDEHDLVLVSRTRPDWLPDETAPPWVCADLSVAGWTSSLPAPVDVLIHLAPLPLLEAAVTALEPNGPTRIIAFGTTSRLTKTDSADPAEQRMVREQAAAEAWLADYAASTGARFTLFRPTMIYDGIHDKNVALIARFIRRFGFFPLVGDASGRRQPVHAGDLAQACRTALTEETTIGKFYDLAGGETLAYRQMVDRLFAASGKKPRCVRIPPPLLRGALSLARIVPRFRYLNAAMADRMNKDMVFDCDAAARDFGYNPSGFEPKPEK